MNLLANLVRTSIDDANFSIFLDSEMAFKGGCSNLF